MLLLHQEVKDKSLALHSVERVKSRAFLDQLATIPLPKPPQLAENLYRREQALLEQLRGLLSAQRRATGKRLMKLEEQLGETEQELKRVWQKMAQSAPEHVALRQGSPISWQEVQKCLQVI